jgi:L-asparagine transporter-like permease
MLFKLPFHPSSIDNCTGIDASNPADPPVSILGLPIEFIIVMMVLVLQMLKKGQEGLMSARVGSALKESMGMMPEGVRKRVGSLLMSALGGLGSLVVVAAAGKAGHEANLDRSYRRVSSRRGSEHSGAMFELD